MERTWWYSGAALFCQSEVLKYQVNLWNTIIFKYAALLFENDNGLWKSKKSGTEQLLFQ